MRLHQDDGSQVHILMALNTTNIQKLNKSSGKITSFMLSIALDKHVISFIQIV